MDNGEAHTFATFLFRLAAAAAAPLRRPAARPSPFVVVRLVSPPSVDPEVLPKIAL